VSAPEGEPAAESDRAAAPAGQDAADLVNRGNALLDLGDLASARLFYRLAADRGSPEGAMLMGMTFDPVYFARTGIQGTQPQIQDALHWYGKAITMGSRPAEMRMGELRSWLERSAAAGDARARAALQQPR
jgi:TPR repeat protein